MCVFFLLPLVVVAVHFQRLNEMCNFEIDSFAFIGFCRSIVISGNMLPYQIHHQTGSLSNKWNASDLSVFLSSPKRKNNTLTHADRIPSQAFRLNAFAFVCCEIVSSYFDNLIAFWLSTINLHIRKWWVLVISMVSLCKRALSVWKRYKRKRRRRKYIGNEMSSECDKWLEQVFSVFLRKTKHKFQTILITDVKNEWFTSRFLHNSLKSYILIETNCRRCAQWTI